MQAAKTTVISGDHSSTTLSRVFAGAYTIWKRDLIRFWRDRSRAIGAFMQPTLYLFVLGTGLGVFLRGAPASGGADYIQFIYPGIMGMSLLFTSIFSAVSIVWDREFGFLKEVLVAPMPRSAIAIGKAFGGATVATLQGALILVYAPLIGIKISLLTIPIVLVLMFVISFAITSLGVVVAARMKTMEGFQVIMNFLIMPLFFLSGALFPVTNLPGWLGGLVHLDPLTYGVDALRNLVGPASGPLSAVYPLWLDVATIMGFGALMIGIAVWLFNRQE